MYPGLGWSLDACYDCVDIEAIDALAVDSQDRVAGAQACAFGWTAWLRVANPGISLDLCSDADQPSGAFLAIGVNFFRADKGGIIVFQ